MKTIISVFVVLSLLVVGVFTNVTRVADAGNCQTPKSGYLNTSRYEDGPATWWYNHDGGKNANGTYRPMSPACRPTWTEYPQGGLCRNNFTCTVPGETDCVPSGIHSFTAGPWGTCIGSSWNNCGTPPCSSPDHYDPLY